MKKFFLCIVVSLMMIFTSAVPAFAADHYTPVTGGTFKFKHFLKMDKEAHVPPITFVAKIVPGAASSKVFAGIGNPTIGSLTYTADSQTYDTVQTDDDVNLHADEKYARGEINVNFTSVSFETPGIYRYIISGDKTGASGGVSISPQAYLDVYVSDEAQDGVLKVTSYFLHPMDNDNLKLQSITDEYVAGNLMLYKNVIGNLGSKTKDFDFSVKIDAGPVKKKYTLKIDGKPDVELTSQTAVTIQLKHGEFATIYGVSEDDKYTITEANYAAEEYSTSYRIDAETSVTGLSIVDKAMGKGDTEVEFTNDREIEHPITGIILDRLPYILMIALAIGLGSLIFLKKRTKLSNK